MLPMATSSLPCGSVERRTPRLPITLPSSSSTTTCLSLPRPPRHSLPRTTTSSRTTGAPPPTPPSPRSAPPPPLLPLPASSSTATTQPSPYGGSTAPATSKCLQRIAPKKVPPPRPPLPPADVSADTARRSARRGSRGTAASATSGISTRRSLYFLCSLSLSLIKILHSVLLHSLYLTNFGIFLLVGPLPCIMVVNLVRSLFSL
ncbi:CCT isoform X1 [Iris pallida]|uniref:CCT isoform X1 n=1 Tax=Iris pallida TaxID=29817 RepID=A0AAX6HV68_IRIPA|nr:CCT isoform X1 [Iris pallida]